MLRFCRSAAVRVGASPMASPKTPSPLASQEYKRGGAVRCLRVRAVQGERLRFLDGVRTAGVGDRVGEGERRSPARAGKCTQEGTRRAVVMRDAKAARALQVGNVEAAVRRKTNVGRGDRNGRA